jgi:alkanesulfonate monooxygenase SsuD/methylene tetrahydromethanopterin reductase-like flavin-dependent oxidoreductase (luciferase family)
VRGDGRRARRRRALRRRPRRLGPQIVEGWYGQPWGSPYWRTRDYVAIMRKIFRREAPASHQGREISLPYEGPGALGVGKPLRSILHMNPDIPIYLAPVPRRWSS